ncbi:MAG: DNA alkylation repair protein [Chitinophagaceae bacterium]
MKEIINKLLKVENGFKLIKQEAINLFNSKTISELMNLIPSLLSNSHYQIRSLGVFLLGFIASTKVEALKILRTEVSYDESWQVQEILAKSFDRDFKDIGYENALPTITDLLNDKNPKVFGAVTEGLRIWTSRGFFKTHPQKAIELISQHKNSDSKYLRKSVGNSLRDISKKHEGLVEKEISLWDIQDRKILYTYKFVTKNKK